MLKSLVSQQLEANPLRFRVAETLDEILTLELLAKEALAESRFQAARFSPEKFTKAAKRAAADTSRHGVLIATRSDRSIGFAYCNIGEPLVGTGLLITTVQVLYVGRSTRDTLLGGKAANALLNGVLSWNEVRQGAEVLIHLTSGIRSAETHSFLKKRGFETIGGSYAKKQ
jgi:rhodanese-related sulfurtransferase